MAFEFTPPPVDSLEPEVFTPPPLDSLEPMTERDSRWLKLNAERESARVEQDIADDSSALRRVVADPAIALAKGVISVPEAAVGLADIVSKGRAGKAVEDAGFKFREAKDILSSYQTGEQQMAQGRVAQAKGFIPTVQALVENPTVAAESIIESLPLMFGGGALSQAALKGIAKIGPKFATWAAGASAPVIAGAVGEGLVGAGSAAENIRQQSPDGFLTWEQAGYAAASGAGTAAFGILGGKAAQKLGLEDIQTALARGGTSAAQKTALPKFKAIIAGALQEGALEELPQSMQEQMFSNLALGKPWDQGLAEAAAQGFVAGAAMGGSAQLVSGRGQPAATPAAAAPATPPAATVAPAPVPAPQVAPPQASQRVSVPIEPPPMPKVSGLMLNQPLSTWSTSPSSPNILAQSPDSFGIGNKVVKLSQAGGGFGKVGTVTAMTGPKVDGNPNATVTVKFDDGTTAVSGFKEFGFLENVQQAKAMSEAARGKPFEFPLPPPTPKVALPEPPAKVDSKRTIPLDAAEQLQQRINAARAAGDTTTARKLAGELDMLGASQSDTSSSAASMTVDYGKRTITKRVGDNYDSESDDDLSFDRGGIPSETISQSEAERRFGRSFKVGDSVVSEVLKNGKTIVVAKVVADTAAATPKPVTPKPRRTAITPAAQAAAPKRAVTLPEAPSLPEPLEGQPYDTRLTTRPEATMPARPVGELGIERGSVSPVDPDLAAAVEDIRGGYSERTARELEEGKASKEAEDYRMQHRPNSDGPQAHDLLSTDLAPRDIYDRPDYYSGEPASKAFRESVSALRKIRGKPDAEITVYRASPKNLLNEGDWISFSKSYSKQHGMADDPSKDVPVHAFKVKARDVRWAGDTLEEFGYYPSSPQPPYAPQEQAPVEVLRNQPPGTPAQVAEGKPDEVSQAARQGEAEAQQGRVAGPAYISPEELLARQPKAAPSESVARMEAEEAAYRNRPRKQTGAELQKEYLAQQKAAKQPPEGKPGEVSQAAGQGEAQPDKDLVAKTPPAQRVDIDNGTRVQEFRARLTTSAEMGEQWVNYYTKPWVVERRTVKRNLDTGEVDNGEWSPFARGETKQKAIEDATGDTAFLRAESVDDTHKKVVARELFGQSWRADKKKRLDQATNEVRWAEDALLRVKDDANKKYKTALKRAKLYEAAQTNQADPVKLKAVQEKLQAEVFPLRDKAKADLDKAKASLAAIEAETQPPYTPPAQPDQQLSLGSTPSTRPAQSLSKMQVEQAVRELFSDSATPPNFQVTHNYGKVFNGREVRGWYDPATGTIWLNAAYLRSPQEARAVFVEEAFHAIQNDKAVQKELSRLVASLTPEQIAEARSAYGNISEEQLRMEAVADILEQQQLTQEQRGMLSRLWDAVLGAIQRLYGKFTGKVFTERDAQDVLAKALKAAAAGRRSLKSGGEVYAEGGAQNQLDQQYLAAVQRGDMQEVQRLVDEAARGAGYNVGPVWQGSNSKWTTFRVDYSAPDNDFGRAIYTSTDRIDAEQYDYNRESAEPNVNRLFAKIGRPLRVGGNQETVFTYKKNRDGSASGTLEDFLDALSDVAPKFGLDDTDIAWVSERIAEQVKGGKISASRLHEIIKKDDVVVRSNEGMEEFAPGELARQAFSSLGFDSVIDSTPAAKWGEKEKQRHLTERTQHIILFDPSQIKSADPITYDSDGQPIPLSQRFQQESPDIRYSLGAPVSQSDATEVQGRAIEPSLVAAASRAVADLGRQQVEEFERAGRQLEGLAYESESFRNARSELNNLVSLHEGRLRQLPQDRVTDDMRANIHAGVSIENGQIVVGDELMGVKFRPELVRALQAEVHFEQQARRLVDNLGKLSTLKELKDYYIRIKAPADEIEKLNELIAAKEKVVAALTPVTTDRGRGQQSIGERASEITRANASKVELQAKRDALTLEPVQEFFGKGITELRDLSEKAKAAADLTRALMDSSTSISEVARLGEIYDKWASFDQTVKDALKKGTLTDEQRASVLTSLQRSFDEFDIAKSQMDDLLNSEEKGLLKDIRLAEADIADAKVTEGMSEILVKDALKAAKGEMGLTGTVGDAARIENVEKLTDAITTLAMNLGRTLDQNRWLYDFLMAPGAMPAFGANIQQSLFVTDTALREILKVVQQSPSLASAIVTLTDDAAAKLANSPPNQMQSIATLATSGNPVGMALAANLTSQIVQQANAQGTKANAARQTAARQLAQSVLRLRTLQQGQALFNQTANSPAFQQLRGAANAGASVAQKMVVLGPTGPVLRGFKSAAKEYQPELKIDVDTNALELSKTRDKVWKYLQNAEQYVADYEAAAALHAANPANPSPSQLGFDVADYNGLRFAIENQIWPMFLNMGDMDDAARAAQYLTPVAVRKLMKAPMFIKEVFSQYEQIGKMVGGFAGNTFRQQIAKYKRGYLNAKRVASQFQDLPKLQSAAMQSHNIRSEDTYRKIFNEMAHYGRLFGTPLRVGFTLPISNQIVTKEDIEFLKRTLAFEEKLRREVTEIDPVTGVRYMRGGKEITRRGAYVGDLGMPRHLNRDATQFIADVTNAYAATPKGFTPATDLSSSSTDKAVKYWNQHLGTLKQHILDSLRTDRTFKQTAEMAAAEKRIAARWLAGNMNQVNSVQDLVDLIAAEIPATNGINPLDTARQGLNNELLQYVSHAQRIQKERADDNAKNSGLSIALSSENEFTKPAANLELPSEYYDYGAVSSIDRITAQSRSNHSSLIDFANSIRLAIKELDNRLGRLRDVNITDKERALLLENYNGNQQELEDVMELLKTSLRNFEDSYRAGGPDIVPTRIGQKILKATVGSVLAKIEIAVRNLSQGQIQVFLNLRAMNYMSVRLAAWKALSNVPRGVINTSYMVARNVAGFADRRLGRDPQFQRTLKGAVDLVADGIFKTAQAAMFKPMVGAENVRKSFERVFNLGFDTSGDSWDATKQAWAESGQFRNQQEQNEAMKSRTSRAINFVERIANTGLDAASAIVRGSVLESSDTGMNALSLGLVGNMEQRLEEVAMVFGKRLTDAGITRIDPTDKRAILQPSEWLPSLNQQTAVNSLGEIRKFLESSATSEGFLLEKNLLQYYQDKMAGRPAEIFNQRTFDAVQRSIIAENNAALPTNRASAGQASTLWRTLLTLQGYPADAFLKLLRISTGGSRDRKVVLQAVSKISLALGFAAMAIVLQGSGDAGSEWIKRKLQGKRADRPTPLDADFYSDPDHFKRAMGNYILLSSYYLGDIIRGAYGWVDGRSTIDPLQKAFALATASQILRDGTSGLKIALKGGSPAEVLEPLRKSMTRLTFGAPELEYLLGKERDNTEAARRGMMENAKAKGFEIPSPGFGGTVGLTNVKRKALSQAVSDMDIAQRKGDAEGYAKAKAAAQKQLTELEAYYLKQRLEAGDSPEVAAKTAKASVWGDYQENNPVTAALGGKRPTAEQYKQLVESSTGERGEVIRQGIKAWQDGAQALFGKPGNITKEDVAENRPGGTVREPSYGRVSLTGGVSGRMKSVGVAPSRGRRAKIRRISLTGRRRKISPMRSRRKKIRRVRLTA